MLVLARWMPTPNGRYWHWFAEQMLTEAALARFPAHVWKLTCLGPQLRCFESSAVRALPVIPGRVPLQSFTPVNIKQGITDYELAPKYQLPPLETHMQNVNWYEIPILIY